MGKIKPVALVITGYPGSGSTSLGINLAKRLLWPSPYYAGGVVRLLTKLIENYGSLEVVGQMTPRSIADQFECGTSVLQPEISKLYKNFPQELDRLVDAVQEELLVTKEVGVHEGRVAPHLVDKIKRAGRAPEKVFIKILCGVSSLVGAERLLRRPENFGKSLTQIAIETSDRIKVERLRYKTLYGIEDHLNEKYFDIVFTTDESTETETWILVLDAIKSLYPCFVDYIPKK